MKIYFYEQETGIYLGEDFADEAPMERGKFVIPADATSIAPPPVDKGRILVFNSREQRWDVHTRSEMNGGLP